MADLMNYGVYSVYDCATEQYGLPFVANNKEEAIRECVSTFLGVDDVVLTDMSIFEIGEYNPVDGIITGYPADSRFKVCDSDTLIKKITQVRIDLDALKKKAYAELDELKKIRAEMDKPKEVK